MIQYDLLIFASLTMLSFLILVVLTKTILTPSQSKLPLKKVEHSEYRKLPKGLPISEWLSIQEQTMTNLSQKQYLKSYVLNRLKRFENHFTILVEMTVARSKTE